MWCVIARRDLSDFMQRHCRVAAAPRARPCWQRTVASVLGQRGEQRGRLLRLGLIRDLLEYLKCPGQRLSRRRRATDLTVHLAHVLQRSRLGPELSGCPVLENRLPEAGNRIVGSAEIAVYAAQ